MYTVQFGGGGGGSCTAKSTTTTAWAKQYKANVTNSFLNTNDTSIRYSFFPSCCMVDLHFKLFLLVRPPFQFFLVDWPSAELHCSAEQPIAFKPAAWLSTCNRISWRCTTSYCSIGYTANGQPLFLKQLRSVLGHERNLPGKQLENLGFVRIWRKEAGCARVYWQNGH